jgi:sec-independent protein translocase protein TatA
MEALTPGHLVVIAIVAFVLFFGWKQLPDMSRSLGRSLRIFKTEIAGVVADDGLHDTMRAALADAKSEFGAAAGAVNRPLSDQESTDVA